MNLVKVSLFVGRSEGERRAKVQFEKKGANWPFLFSVWEIGVILGDSH